MARKIILDDYEKEIERNFEHQKAVPHLKDEMAMLTSAAALHTKRKKSITLRVSEMDLEAMKIKASRAGIPYQTYINMIIHQDAASL